MPDEIKTDPDWPTPKVKQEIKTEPCEKNSNTCFPVEFVENQLPAKTGLGWKSAEAAFEQLMIEKPWEHDDEVCDETLIPAPKSYLSKPKQGERSPRQCWLRLRRSWLKKNFMRHMIAAGNIRYKSTTYSSLCHHPTTPWDCHPLCWQCYKDLGLPLCGYEQNIECKYCRMMGVTAKQARVDKLKLKHYERRNYAAKTALPSGVYTQADADEWLEAKNIHQMPNPDWLLKGQPVGNCFPAQLIVPGKSVAEAIRANPKWQSQFFSSEVKAHNNLERPRRLVNKTTSQLAGVFVPKCCDWGEEVNCEQDQETVPKKLNSWATKLASEFEKTCKAMDVMTQRLLSTAANSEKPATVAKQDLSAATCISEASDLGLSTDYTEEGLKEMTPEKMRRVILEQQAKINQSQRIQEEIEAATTSAQPIRSRTCSLDAREIRAEMKSPFLDEQFCLPPITDRFDEKKVKCGEWSQKEAHSLVGSPLVDVAKSDLNKLVAKMHDLKLGVNWVKQKGKDGQDQEREVSGLMIHHEFLVRYWQLMGDLRSKSPFNIKFEFPNGLGAAQGLAPHFLLRATQLLKDVEGCYPKGDDHTYLSFDELEQWVKYGNAAITLNNIVFIANRLLMWRLEDLSTPLAPDREAERVLCAVIREASALLNDVEMKSNIIAKSVMRRDAMLRKNLDPSRQPVTFTSPVPSPTPFHTNLGDYFFI